MKSLVTILAVVASGAWAAEDPATVRAAPAAGGAIHSVAYSHGDLGYGNYPHVLRTENRLENLFRAIRYCDETASWPSESQYRWQQEMAEPLPFFLGSCTPEQREKLARYVREGRISIAATHATVLSDRLNGESAARLFYLSNRFLPDLLGTPPGRVAIINDVVGLSWSLPVYCEAAGVPFLSMGHNKCARMDELESAPLVRWTGPGGTGSVLAFSSVYNYHAVSKPGKEVPDAVARSAAEITPHFVPVWLQGHDFSLASLEMATAAKTWNVTNTPRVQMSTLDLYLSELARRQPPEQTPVVNKTGPCQWMDQPLSDAWLFGRARQAGERLPAAEKFSAFALASSPGGYPWFDFTTGWHNLLSHFEHTSGAACWRTKDAEGWRHYETELVEHREEGLLALKTAERTLEAALSRLGAQIKTTHANALAVFNPLGQARTDVVTLSTSAQAGQALVAVDDATGLTTPCQWLDADTLVFVATDVPALGYRTFHLREQPRPAAPVKEHRFYAITIDPKTGAVVSLVDKELGHELVKPNAPHAFNQYLYQWCAEAEGEPLWSEPPSDVAIAAEHGPVASIFRIRANKAAGVNWLEQTITLYRTIKRIDFALRLDKKPSGRTLADYHANNLRGKESVFIALPFDIPDFKAVYQTGGGGVAEPVRDQFTGTCTAFQAVQHFADLSNERFGVTVSPIDCALVEFGHPRSDVLSRTLNSESAFEKKMEYPQAASLYLYLLDNMFTTNIRIDQRGEHLFRWALRSHAGNWQAGEADRFGEAVNQPLLARLLPPGGGPRPVGAHSFAAVEGGNVSVSTCKPAEWNGDGFIVRLVETRGRKTTADLRLPFLLPIASANETTLTETDLDRPLVVRGDAVRVELPAYGVKTIRVRRAAAATGAVTKLTATPVSDLEVALEWTPVPDAACYRVYRGTTADFQPTLLTLVAMPAVARCVDKAQNHGPGWMANRLTPGTTYHYRVEAVSRHHTRGPASASVAATTMSTEEKACPPGAVQDLHAILVSPLAPLNQINLLWRSNVEPNIAGYEIHRSTTPGFTPSPSTLLAKVEVRTSAKATDYRHYDHQMFLDKDTAPGAAYRYRVRAITQSGLPGGFSAEAGAATKAEPVAAAPSPTRGRPELLGQGAKRE
jgi:alpha-mannosidase